MTSTAKTERPGLGTVTSSPSFASSPDNRGSQIELLSHLVAAGIALRKSAEHCRDLRAQQHLKSARQFVRYAMENLSPSHVAELSEISSSLEFAPDSIGDVCAAIRKIEDRDAQELTRDAEFIARHRAAEGKLDVG